MNSALLIGADGAIRDAYDKNLLIPLAERRPRAAAAADFAYPPAAGRQLPPCVEVLPMCIAVRRVAWLATLGTPLLLVLVSAAAQSASFVVGSTQDAPDASPGDGVCAAAGGVCTLRAAIQEANALPGYDLVFLPGGTYALAVPGRGEDQGATGDLDITDGLAIVGDGAGVTEVDGMALDRVFHVASSEPVDVFGLSIVGGVTTEGEFGAGVFVSPPLDGEDPGGALFEDVVVAENSGADPFASAVEVEYFDGGGDVVFSDSVIGDNLAIGLATLGYFADVVLDRTDVVANESDGLLIQDMWVTIEDSEISYNGMSGIHGSSDSFIWMRRSTVGWNALEGLAALGYGLAEIDSSTVRDNGGTGLFNHEYFQEMRVHNSTITGNAGGGIYNDAELVVSSSTIARNRSDAAGGGVRLEDLFPFSASISTSIIAENEAPGAADCAVVGLDAFPSDGHNLIGDASGCNLAPGPGDQAGSAAAPLDPRLGALAEHGGRTASFALLPGSPAVDAVPEAACVYDHDGDAATPPVPLPTDQRGVARPQGTSCDVGAFELPEPGGSWGIAAGALLLALLHGRAPRRLRGHRPS